MALSDRSIERKQLDRPTPRAGNLHLHQGSPWTPPSVGGPALASCLPVPPGEPWPIPPHRPPELTSLHSAPLCLGAKILIQAPYVAFS